MDDGGLRASDVDREEAAGILDIALREGRLDLILFDKRMLMLWDATTRADVAAAHVDLPDHEHVRERSGHLRVRGDDRQQAARWLADAHMVGRLTDAEYEERCLDLVEIGTYAALDHVLDGVPGRRNLARDEYLVSTQERETAFAWFEDGFVQGRLTIEEHERWTAQVRTIRRFGPLRLLVNRVDGLADPTERATAAALLASAFVAGRLSVPEYAERTAELADCCTDWAVAQLFLDLDTTPLVVTPDNVRTSPAPRRLADDDRDQALGVLKVGLDKGRLSLAEYDDRVRQVPGAVTVSDLRPLLDDLGTPASIYRQRPSWTGRVAAIVCFVLASAAVGFAAVATCRNSSVACVTVFVGVLDAVALACVPSRDQPDYLTGRRRRPVLSSIFALSAMAGGLLQLSL